MLNRKLIACPLPSSMAFILSSGSAAFMFWRALLSPFPVVDVSLVFSLIVKVIRLLLLSLLCQSRSWSQSRSRSRCHFNCRSCYRYHCRSRCHCRSLSLSLSISHSLSLSRSDSWKLDFEWILMSSALRISTRRRVRWGRWQKSWISCFEVSQWMEGDVCLVMSFVQSSSRVKEVSLRKHMRWQDGLAEIMLVTGVELIVGKHFENHGSSAQ